MSPIEHYFENLLTIGSDIKGEPNKNVLSKEVQEAIEICASYIKFNNSLCGNKGHWTEEFNDLEGEVRFTCSTCGKYQLFGTDFCYHCGSDNREVEK